MFWDKLKPSPVEPRASSVDVAPGGEVVVTWDDGKVSRVASRRLRAECPCAACVDEWSGERRVGLGDVAENVRPAGMDPVGNYAVRFRWSDGHDTGLYSWRQLRGYLVT